MRRGKRGNVKGQPLQFGNQDCAGKTVRLVYLAVHAKQFAMRTRGRLGFLQRLYQTTQQTALRISAEIL